MSHEDLEAEVLWLRSVVGLMGDDAVCVHKLRAYFGFTSQVARVLLWLYATDGKWIDWRTIRDRLETQDNDTQRPDNLIRLYVHKARKALGYTAVETSRGLGYRMTQHGRQAMAKALA